MKKVSIIASVFLCLSSTSSFGFDFGSLTDSVKNAVKSVTTSSETSTDPSSSAVAASDSTATSGIKEALKVGINYAVDTLGATDGYLSNSLVKIPLPENLQKVEGVIRKVGGDDVADDLINSMNSAATKAAPQTAEIFVDAIDSMSVTDAQNILSGGDDAATEYFKTNTTSSLKEMILPIVQETMQENKVASYYDAFNGYYKEYGKDLVDNSSVGNLAKSLGVDSYLPTSSDQDLDEYVTEKAIDGLFIMIAEKEAAIRSDPVEQTTALLKQVFGQ